MLLNLDRSVCPMMGPNRAKNVSSELKNKNTKCIYTHASSPPPILWCRNVRNVKIRMDDDYELNQQASKTSGAHTHTFQYTLYSSLNWSSGSLPGGSLLSPLASLWLNPPSPAPDVQHKTDTANCTSSILIICLLSLKHQFHSMILPPPCRTVGTVDLQLHFCFIRTQDFSLSAAFGSRDFFLAVNLSSHSDSRHTVDTEFCSSTHCITEKRGLRELLKLRTVNFVITCLSLYS